LPVFSLNSGIDLSRAISTCLVYSEPAKLADSRSAEAGV
jgi:hypothetical protein